MFSYSPKFYQERLQRLVRKVYLHMSRGHTSLAGVKDDRLWKPWPHRVPCPIGRARNPIFHFALKIDKSILCSFVLYPLHKLSLQLRQNRSKLPAHYILGAQKKRLIETGLLSTHNIRGHMFWLKKIKCKYRFFLRFKDESFTMVSFIIMKVGSYSEPSIRRVKCCVFVCLTWFFTSNHQYFSYVGTGLPGLNQY